MDRREPGTAAPAALLLAGLLPLSAACGNSPERPAGGNGTTRMAQRLVAITRELDPTKNMFQTGADPERQLRRQQLAAGDRAGDARAIESIEVRWPATAEIQVFRDVGMDRVYRVVEGEAALAPVLVIPLQF
jgi:hypothetical protein